MADKMQGGSHLPASAKDIDRNLFLSTSTEAASVAGSTWFDAAMISGASMPLHDDFSDVEEDDHDIVAEELIVWPNTDSDDESYEMSRRWSCGSTSTAEPASPCLPVTQAAAGKAMRTPSGGLTRKSRRGAKAVPAPSDPEIPVDADNMTTLMIRNLPMHLSQQKLLQELDNSGFEGLYDFCYLPRDFSSGHSKRYAFVNLTTPQAARDLMAMWNKCHRLGLRQRDQPLDISPAHIQGCEANAAIARSMRMRRVRNQTYRRLVLDPTDTMSGDEGCPTSPVSPLSPDSPFRMKSKPALTLSMPPNRKGEPTPATGKAPGTWHKDVCRPAPLMTLRSELAASKVSDKASAILSTHGVAQVICPPARTLEISEPTSPGSPLSPMSPTTIFELLSFDQHPAATIHSPKVIPQTMMMPAQPYVYSNPSAFKVASR